MPTFTANWFPSTVFDEHLSFLKGRQSLRFLEVGVFEGKGTCYFFEEMLGETGTLVAIDPFLAYSESTITKMKGFDHVINEESLNRFRSNTKPFENRITLFQGLSQNILPVLKDETFDLAFVDGDHSREAVALDGRECFRLLKDGGYLVFDDYLWGFKDRPETSPKEAIDRFLQDHDHEIKIIHKTWCVIIQKHLPPLIQEDLSLSESFG